VQGPKKIKKKNFATKIWTTTPSRGGRGGWGVKNKSNPEFKKIKKYCWGQCRWHQLTEILKSKKIFFSMSI
jgi:hypothetical protein